jgi:hypothetical protein
MPGLVASRAGCENGVSAIGLVVSIAKSDVAVSETGGFDWYADSDGLKEGRQRRLKFSEQIPRTHNLRPAAVDLRP